MHRRSRLLLAAAGAAFALALAASAASANRLSISSNGVRIVFPEITFERFELGVEISCDLTLEGSFHSRTIAKVAGSLVGIVTRVGSRACSSSDFLLESLPWHIRYGRFAGLLPNITMMEVKIVGFSFQYTEIGGQRCLYRGTEANPTNWEFTREFGGTITEFRPTPAEPLQFSSGWILCPTYMTYAGNARVMALGTTTPIGLTLI